MRDYKRAVKDWVHSTKSNTPRWFIVLTVASMIVVSTAAMPTLANEHDDGDNIIDSWEDGSDTEWSANDYWQTVNNTAYHGEYSYQYTDTGAGSRIASLSVTADTPKSLSARIYFESLESSDDTSWADIAFTESGGVDIGRFEFRGNDVYRTVSGDQNSWTDTGVDIQTGRWVTVSLTNINYTDSTVDYQINGEVVATDISTESALDNFGQVVLEGDNGHFYVDYITKNFASSYEVSGKVINGENEPVSNANVSISTSPETTVQTGPSGRYSVYVENGTYQMEASKQGYFTDTANVTVDGQPVTQNFRIRNLSKALTINTRNYLKHGDKAEYTVFFATEETNRTDVTNEASISSNDTSVITINRATNEIVATSNTSVNKRTYVKATYTDSNGTAYATTADVTVANSTVENLAILPTIWRVNATFGSSTIQAILIAIFAGVFGARITTSFGGLALMQMAMIAGWVTGYASVGITMISLFAALFIGLNMAANIDYTVRQ